MAADEALLENVSLFALLDQDERRAIAERMSSVCFHAGDIIFNFGDPGDALYLIGSGKIELFLKDKTGEKITFLIAEKGEIFGEISCFDMGPRTTCAQVIEDCELLMLEREDLIQFLLSKPDAAVDLLAVAGRRLRETNSLLIGRVSRNTNREIEQNLTRIQKVANFIAEYSGSMQFLTLNAVLFFVWISLNLGFVPFVQPFDPYPFGLLTMAVSLEAIFLSIFVLLAQNLQAAKDRLRGDVEYEINLKAELEVAELHEKFDLLHSEVLKRLHSIERSTLGRAGT